MKICGTPEPLWQHTGCRTLIYGTSNKCHWIQIKIQELRWCIYKYSCIFKLARFITCWVYTFQILWYKIISVHDSDCELYWWHIIHTGRYFGSCSWAQTFLFTALVAAFPTWLDATDCWWVNSSNKRKSKYSRDSVLSIPIVWDMAKFTLIYTAA